MISIGIDPGLATTGILATSRADWKVIFRGKSSSVPTMSDDERRDKIVAEVVAACESVRAEFGPATVTLEGYEFQGGKRANTKDGARIVMLIGELRRALIITGFRVRIVTRNTWGRALGIHSNSQLARALVTRYGVRPGRNAHEDDAAALAWYGAMVGGL